MSTTTPHLFHVSTCNGEPSCITGPFTSESDYVEYMVATYSDDVSSIKKSYQQAIRTGIHTGLGYALMVAEPYMSKRR
jgi:hypothetical protein